MIVSPVFLVGAERSGTTLLRLMLSHHPQISFDNESEYLVDPMPPAAGLPSLEDFVRHLKRSRSFELKKGVIRPDLDVVELANDIVAQKAGGRQVKVYGATVHRHFDRLLRIWPEARFLHLVRDGRDVAESTIPMGWSGNMYVGIGRWLEAEDLWGRMAAHLPADRHITVYYEALVTDPVGELTKICHFMGVDFDQAMLGYDKSSTYSKPNTASIAKWRSLPRSKVAPAESRAADFLTKHNYPLSGPISVPGAMSKLYYKLHDRWGRMRFGQRQLGFTLWLERLIARRIGGTKWRESVRQRERAIVNRHLK
jgi:hypothetical protein